MNLHADKTAQNKTQTFSNLPVQEQNSNSAGFKFIDNRPEAIVQRKLQEAISESPRVLQLKAYHEMANNYNPIQRIINGEGGTDMWAIDIGIERNQNVKDAINHLKIHETLITVPTYDQLVENIKKGRYNHLLPKPYTDISEGEAITASRPVDSGDKEEKGEIPDALPTEESTSGPRKIMVIPTDLVEDVSKDPPLADAYEWDEAQLMAWEAAYDQFHKTKDNLSPLVDKRPYYNRANKLSDQHTKVQQLLKSPPLVRKRSEKEIEDAKTLTETELLKLRKNNWLQLSEGEYLGFINHVKNIITDPTVMNQGGYPLCGPDVVLRSIAIYKPMVYARYMISLVEGKEAKIGNKTFNITEPVKAKRYKEKKGVNIPDLLGMSALRSASNSRAYNKIRSDGNKNFAARWHAGISGSTTLSQAVTWVKEMGVNDTDIKQGSYLFFSNSNSSVLTTVNDYLQRGHAVMLMINQAIIDNGPNTPVSKSILYRHWVNLIHDFEKKETDWTANVLTWGKLKPMRFQEAQISRSILGFLAVDFRNLNNNLD